MISDLFQSFVEQVGRETPDQIIGDPANPYLMRWVISKNRSKGRLYLHKVLRDDADTLHCHPADSMSFIISGVLREILPHDEPRILRPGDVVFRQCDNGADRHKLEIVQGPVWTLFAFGCKKREWGFHPPEGFVHWTKFLDKNGERVGQDRD